MRALSTSELCVLAYTLTDPDKCDAMLDRLSLTNSPGSLRLVYEACRPLHQYGLAQGWCEGEFAMEAPAKNPQPPIVVYRAEEVETLVRTAQGRSLRWFAFVATMAHTGRRVGEVLGLRWEWLHLDSDVPHFNLPHTKNKRQAYVPLDSFLRERVFTPENVAKLQQAPQGQFRKDLTEFPFPWSYNCAHKMFRRHCETVGVEHRSFHRLRHTKATEMLAKGVPIQAVSGLLGHASVQTTDRLYHHATALDYARYLG
jgi:integrase